MNERFEADAHFELAHRCLLAGDTMAALHNLQLGLLRNPDHAPAWTNRGDLLFQMGDPFEALVSYDRAIALMADEPRIWNARGTCLQMLRRYDHARECYDRALALDPRNALALSNEGMLLGPSDPEQSVEMHRAAVAASPNSPELHTYLGIALLRAGHMLEGWEEYEWRVKTEDHGTNGRRISFPAWTGYAHNTSVLLYAEQGFGDAIQFMRYAPVVKKRFGLTVTLEVRPQLVRLARTMAGVDRVIAVGDPVPADISSAASLMSLPRICGARPGHIPDHDYISVPTESTERWRRRLAAMPAGLKVGICWAGGSHRHVPAAADVDGRRSVALADLAPLALVPGISWVSLQTGHPAGEVMAPPPGMVIGAWTDDLDDFHDTAALIDCLDLVISVDTAVVHLAAAMGKPTWLLSRFDNCWRWMGAREDSPWYPSLRQFRQPTWGSWGPVIEQVRRELRVWTAARSEAA